jgi:Domain of unknown function (DUF4440)
MRFLMILIAASALSGCAGAPKNPTWNTATGAEQHERLLWKAVLAKDWNTVERQLSATFVGVSADGRTFDRAGWVQLWSGAEVRQYSLGDVQVLPEGPDMKLTYILHLQAKGITPQATAGLRVVSVWQQVKAGWMLAATSVTPIQNN